MGRAPAHAPRIHHERPFITVAHALPWLNACGASVRRRKDDTVTTRWLTCVIAAIGILAAAACGSTNDESAATGAKPAAATAAPTTPGGLTPFQVEHGIGPVTSPVVLQASVDQSLASGGAKVFEQKCSACHKMTERYVGPALGVVTKRRSPAYVMNMALNPLVMVEKHPEAKKLLGEYFVAMPNQNISPDEARQVVEYLRTQAQ
jgi:mono/diheme cytochrome c family protein